MHMLEIILCIQHSLLYNRFAVVVQNSQNLSQFYAAVETDIIYGKT